MCGLPGSGKTTLAKQLERDLSALRLTPDEWMQRIVGDGYDEEKRSQVEQVQWEIAARVLSLGLNVTLDFGFWSRGERDDFRARAAALGAKSVVKYLDVALDTLKERLAMRNTALPSDTFHVHEHDLVAWTKLFEPPSSDEL
jgi:predicted kinase